MPKLNDTQLILRSNAARRDNHSLFPLPEQFANSGPRATKAIEGLTGRGLIRTRGR